MESLVNNHGVVDGNKRVGFASAHLFLLVNGLDLNVSSRAAVEFLIKAIADGKLRFALLHEWIAAHLVPFLARFRGQECPRHTLYLAHFGTLSTVNCIDSPFIRFNVYV